jgi:hypothetical protein
MRRFLKNTLLFSLILIFFLLVIFIFSIELNQKLFRNFRIDKNINTLIIGDSHTELAINDSLLIKTLNISTPAEGYIFTYLKLKFIFENNDHIRNIMLGVSYHNFSSFYDKYIFEEEPYSLISQYISLMEYRDLLFFLKRTTSVTNLAAIFRNSLENITSYEKEIFPYIGGFHIIDNDDELTDKRISNRINSQYFLNDLPLPTSGINILYLEKIVELCRENDVNLIFLNTPLYADYFLKVPQNMITEYENAVKKSGVREISFCDLQLPADCFLPDGDHLNYKGAMLTTKYLVDYLGNMLQSDSVNRSEEYSLSR